jgi:hypothetical protein
VRVGAVHAAQLAGRAPTTVTRAGSPVEMARSDTAARATTGRPPPATDGEGELGEVAVAADLLELPLGFEHVGGGPRKHMRATASASTCARCGGRSRSSTRKGWSTATSVNTKLQIYASKHRTICCNLRLGCLGWVSASSEGSPSSGSIERPSLGLPCDLRRSRLRTRLDCATREQFALGERGSG